MLEDNMKRDIETIRHILLRIESYNNKPIEDTKVNYHLKIMIDGNIIKGNSMTADNTTFYKGLELTSEGYDLLTGISNKQLWNDIKETLEKNDLTVNDVPIAIIKEVANKIIMNRLEID